VARYAQCSARPVRGVREREFRFYGKTLRGQEELPPRWKRCTNDVDEDLGEALGQAYVAKYFSPEAKQAALKIVQEVEAAMQSEIQALPWMGAATKEQALDQVARDRQQDRLSRHGATTAR
jgi:putative endopeptidase